MTQEHVFAEVQQIKAELWAQGGILRSLLFGAAPHLATEIVEEMEKDPLLARVFLLIDGSRSQSDIVRELADKGPGVSQPNVSRKMKRLTDDFGVIAPVGRGSSGVICAATPVAEALKIEREARRIVKDADRPR